MLLCRGLCCRVVEIGGEEERRREEEEGGRRGRGM